MVHIKSQNVIRADTTKRIKYHNGDFELQLLKEIILPHSLPFFSVSDTLAFASLGSCNTEAEGSPLV